MQFIAADLKFKLQNLNKVFIFMQWQKI